MSFGNIVKREKTDITVDKLVELFPQRKGAITEELANTIHNVNNSEDFNGDEFLDTMISYRDVMLRGKYSLREFVTAVKFCAYLIAENDNTVEAYKRARGDDEFVKSKVGAPTGSSEYNTLTSAASRYRQSKLVRELLTAAQMPLYLMFQGERYKAIEVLTNEMNTAAYSKDRINAADKLLSHAKPPENLQVELEVGPTTEAKSMQEQLSEQLAHTITMQKKMLDAGVDLKDVQKLGLKSTVIEVEVEDK